MNSQHAEHSNRAVIEAFVQNGMANPIFRNGLILARENGLDFICTLQLLTALTSPPPPIQWGCLGHPSANLCKAISDHVNHVAATINSQALGRDVAALGALPGYQGEADLLVYAVLHSAAPIDLAGLISTLGADTVATRLRKFACAIEAACIVG